MPFLFTSESVSSGHPDKIADIISDTLLDYFIAFDNQSRVACETLVTTGQVIVSGEVKSSTYLDVQSIVRKTVNEIGYDNGELQFSGDSCGVISLIHEQSEDISNAITKKNPEDLGAGDQGIMFGYATNETKNYIPLSLDLSHRIIEYLELTRKSNKNLNYLRPDAKVQVTVKYSDDNQLIDVDSILISTQHDDFNSRKNFNIDVLRKDIKFLINEFLEQHSSYDSNLFTNTKFLINPSGRFVIGGPHGDTGLTGRKIIVDTYGGKGSHGGGAFSGKDSTKVDRSAAYYARYLAKNLVAAGVADEIQIQLAYSIGIAKPVSINVNTFGSSKCNYSDSDLGLIISENFELTPFSIQKQLNLNNPIYAETAAHGHFGRVPVSIKKEFVSPYNGKILKEVVLFPWEKLDLICKIKEIILNE